MRALIPVAKDDAEDGYVGGNIKDEEDEDERNDASDILEGEIMGVVDVEDGEGLRDSDDVTDVAGDRSRASFEKLSFMAPATLL